MRDLQEASVSELQGVLGPTVAATIKQLSYGVDDAPVVPFGLPQVRLKQSEKEKCLGKLRF